MSCACGSLMTTGDHWRPLATSGAGARYGRSYASAGTTTLLEHPIRLRRTKVEYGCLLRRLWRRMIVSEFGVCPPRASTGGAGPPYALIHASRYDTPGAPNSPPQVRGRTWIPSVQASGEGDGPGTWSMPHTRRGQPHRASGARPTTTQTRAPKPSPPPYETGRGPRLATRTVHLAGAGSNRHGLRTRMAPRRPSKTIGKRARARSKRMHLVIW
jgi:hypothetical protein